MSVVCLCVHPRKCCSQSRNPKDNLIKFGTNMYFFWTKNGRLLKLVKIDILFSLDLLKLEFKLINILFMNIFQQNLNKVIYFDVLLSGYIAYEGKLYLKVRKNNSIIQL